MKKCNTIKIKQSVVIIALLAISLPVFSLSDNIRLGLTVSPGIAWSNPVSNDLQRGLPHFGVNYGLVFEYWFTRNYGLATGLGGAFDGCTIKGRPALQTFDSTTNTTRSVTEKYIFNYLELPVYLKLKTNDLKGKKICIWGQVGFTLDFTVSARATYSDSIVTGNGEDLWIDKENILRGQNEVAQVLPGFHASYIDIRLGAGGGIEYRLDEKTSLFAGLFYNNGLINNLVNSDSKGNPNQMRFFSLKLGVLF